MSSEQYLVLRDFLLRCHQLSPGARNGLASDIATRITSIVGTPGTVMPAESFINCVTSAYQQRYCAHLFA